MSLISSEKLIRLSDVPKLEWLADPKPKYNTVYRWATDGIDNLKLEAVRQGGVLCTSEPAVRRFFAARNAPPPAKPTTDKQRQTARDRAAARLDAAGIK